MARTLGSDLVRVLGPVELVADGNRVRLRPAQRRLLAILLLEPGAIVDRDTLIDRMWGEHLPATAAAALQVHLSGIRKAAPGLLGSVGGGYQVDLAHHRLDRHAFEQLVARARSAAAAGDPESALHAVDRARALWRGTPYAELEEDDVATEVVARLVALRDELGEIRADALHRLGRTDEAIAERRAAVRRHPLREPDWARLMVALAGAGRQAEALRAYQAARATLGAELGVEPGAELQELAGRIGGGDEPVDARAADLGPSNLPTSTTSFVGREEELQRIADLLSSTRLVTIVGAPGLGKTRLAIEAGQAVRPISPDGVWFVPLAEARTGQDVLAAIAAGTGAQTARPTEASLADRLSRRRATIVLDNCEQVTEPCAAFLRSLLARAGAVRVIATSRAPLRVRGESLVRPAGLLTPTGSHLRAVDAHASPAVRLFLDRARGSDPGFRLTDAATPTVVALCRAAEGLPLALELAAAWLPGLGLQEIGAMLLHESGPSRTLGSRPARQRSLRSAIGWSVGLLAPDDRTLFTALAVFRGPFTLRDVAAVCDPARDWRLTAAAMQRLVDASLVVADRRDDGAVTYRLLVPIRDVARAEFSTLSCRAEIIERLVTHYLGKSARPGEEPVGAAEARALDGDLDNLREACDQALAAGRAEDVARTLVTLEGYFRSRSLAIQELGWLEHALETVREPALRARTLTAAGLAAQATNQLDAALERLEEARSAFEALGDEASRARTLVALAGLHSNRGEWDLGVLRARQARALLAGTDRSLGGLAAFYEGINLAYGGDPRAGVAVIEAAITWFERADDAGRSAHALSTLVMIATWIGDEPLARRHVDAAIRHARRAASPVRVVRALGAAAGVEARWGDPLEAGRMLLEVDEEMGIPEANEDVFELLLPAGFLAARLGAWPLLLDLVDACEARIARTGQGYGVTWSTVTCAWRREAEARVRPEGPRNGTGAASAPASIESVRPALREMLRSFLAQEASLNGEST